MIFNQNQDWHAFYKNSVYKPIQVWVRKIRQRTSNGNKVRPI